jgi:hypothetical protein
MKPKHMLTGTSLFSVLLLSLHLAQDALVAKPGTQAAGSGNLVSVLILFVLLSGPMLLSERRSGQIIIVLAALFSMGMPVIHFTWAHDMHRHASPLLFVWCLIALGVSGLFALMLSLPEVPRVWRGAKSGDASGSERA